MKKDKFVSSIMQGAGYAKENIQNVIIVVVVLVIAIAGIVIWRSTAESNLEKAKTKMGIAQIAYRTGNFGEALDTLNSIITNHSKSEESKVAMFMLGHIYFATGNVDSADIMWKQFLATEFDDPDMVAAAEAGLAAVLSEKGNYQEAGKAFSDCYTEHEKYFDRRRWLIRSGENYLLAGDLPNAKKVFELYLDKYPDKQEADIVKMNLAELNTKLGK